MKIRLIFSLVAGITTVAISPITLAAGHGGGGGGFGGGGFHGGGFSGGGHVASGGVGNRGGGVGFGGMRVPGRVPSFEGAGPRFSSFGHPSHAQPQPSSSLGSRPAIARQSDQRFSNLRNHIVMRHDANWHNDWDRRHAHFDHNRFFVFIGGFWCGLDAGYFPWDYLPYYPNDYYRTITTQTLIRTITTGTPITLIQRTAPRSKPSRRSWQGLAITMVRSTAFLDRLLVMRWRSTKSRIT